MREIESKILTREEAAARLARNARGGTTLALANGCFDIIHVGHVRYLQAAKAEAGLLLVAVNSDASVRKLKGKGRPLQDEGDRAEVIASLACVDFVTIFPEDTVIPLVRLLEPDVQCKGTDYTKGSVPEGDEVRRHGGRVAIVGDPKDHNSSAIILRMNSPGAPPGARDGPRGGE